MVHIRPGRLPSTETGLALCTDRPCAEDPGHSGRSELSGSGPAPGGQERDRLEFQVSLSLHDGSWPSVGPTGPSKDPESRGAMGWKLLLPSHGTAQLAAPSCQRTDSCFPFPVSRFPRHDVTNLIFTPLKWFSFDAPKTFHGVLQNISSWEIQEPISRFPFPECWQLHHVQFPTRPFPNSQFPFPTLFVPRIHIQFPISHFPLGP